MAYKKARKKPNNKNNGRTRNIPARDEQTEAETSLKAEIISIILIAAAILLVLSLVVPSGMGVFGGFINTFLTGAFGIGAYIFPFLIIAASLVIIFGKQKYISLSKLIMIGALFIIVISYANILAITKNVDGEWVYPDIFVLSEISSSGGVVGAIFGNVLAKLLSKIGAYILFITGGVVLLILISEKSLFKFIIWAAEKAKNEGKKIKTGRNERKPDDYEEYYEDPYEEIENNSELIIIDGTVTTKRDPKSFDHIVGSRDHKNREGKINLIDEDISRAKDKKDPYLNAPDFISSKKKRNESVIEKENDEPPFDVDVSEEFSMGFEIKGLVGEIEVPAQKPKKAEEKEIISEIYESLSENEDNETEYQPPSIELLKENTFSASLSSKAQIIENTRKLEETLKSFNVTARVVEVCKGPAVTRYELAPGVGVKVHQISKLADDLALNLAAEGIRIEAPVPGKSVVGIEIPNKEIQAVFVREIIEDEAFQKHPSKLAFTVGKDITGRVVVDDIAKMPHLLIAGSTGSGKSVCINTIITSILYKARPEEVKLIMIDPKVVELNVYNGIPHMVIPVVTDPKKAANALNWAVCEMQRRYNLFAETFTRDLKGYNEFVLKKGEKPEPRIVIIIDELADLMMTAKADVETAICRIAQKARAAGIHLIIATQRPSVDVITGLIKTNVPSRLAFAVTSGIDSRTILDMNGAEKLLGKGDMLFSPMGTNKPQRIQGAFISDKEVEDIVNFIKKDCPIEYDPDMEEAITSNIKLEENLEDADEFFDEAVEFLMEREKASVSMLQRRFRIGYNRAARLMESLEKSGIVGPEDGVKPRKVLLTPLEWDEIRSRRV